MNKLDFHVYDDVTMLKHTGIPLAFYSNAECYIMQESKIVFVGSCKMAEKFMRVNKGKKIECTQYSFNGGN